MEKLASANWFIGRQRRLSSEHPAKADKGKQGTPPEMEVIKVYLKHQRNGTNGRIPNQHKQRTTTPTILY